MASTIAILDGNCYLHVGEAAWSKNLNMLGFPTGGIYQLMSKVCNLYMYGIPFVVVFDSPSFRKSVNSSYKKSRKVDYKILAQAKAIIPMLKRAGVNTLQVPEFEGDDLVANVIAANPDYNHIIYTCDYDIAINVSSRVSVCGCKSGFPAINNSNFENVMSRVQDTRVPYNTLGMYKVIFGCDSDEIQSVGAEANKLWNMFIAIYDRDYTSKDKAILVGAKYCSKFIAAVGSRYNSDTVRKFNENIVLVFPRMLTDKEIADNGITLNSFSDVRDTDLADICHLFGMKKLYRMLLNDDDRLELSDREREWLLKRSRDYKLRSDAVDAEIDINKVARFNSSDDSSDGVTQDFDAVTNGLNIGTF